LRSSDIVNLKFENLNWEKSEISLIQQKTKKALTLPLLTQLHHFPKTNPRNH